MLVQAGHLEKYLTGPHPGRIEFFSGLSLFGFYKCGKRVDKPSAFHIFRKHLVRSAPEVKNTAVLAVFDTDIFGLCKETQRFLPSFAPYT